MKDGERAVLRRWTRHERLIDHGFLREDDPIELLDGLLMVKEPQHSPHRTAVLLMARALEGAFGEGWFVQTQSPRSGLRIARGRKARGYARARITDYWIVNLVDRVLEVHREPARPGPARPRWGYASIDTLGADATVTPLAAPSAALRVADLLP